MLHCLTEMDAVVLWGIMLSLQLPFHVLAAPSSPRGPCSATLLVSLWFQAFVVLVTCTNVTPCVPNVLSCSICALTWHNIYIKENLNTFQMRCPKPNSRNALQTTVSSQERTHFGINKYAFICMPMMTYWNNVSPTRYTFVLSKHLSSVAVP